jgi:hypothetical protein
MVFPQAEARHGHGDATAIPSISPPAHRLAAFLHKPSTGSCTERVLSRCASHRPAMLCPLAPWSHDVTRLLVSRTLPSFAALAQTGFPRGSSYPMAAVASGMQCEVTCAPDACLLPSPRDHPWFPAPQGAGGTMFPPSTTAASSRLPGAFETAHRGFEGCQQRHWHQASRALQVQSVRAGVLRSPGPALPDSRGNAVSRTPAAGLARLKVQHPGWVIRRRVLPGQAAGYTAHRKFSRGGFQSLRTGTLGGLERALFLAEKGKLDEAGGRRPLPRQHRAR